MFAPLGELRRRMEALQQGRLEISVPWAGRSDDIGQIARAVASFRDAAVKRVEMEAEAEALRETAKANRIAAEQERHRIAEEDARTIMRIMIAEGKCFPALTEFYYRELIAKIIEVLGKVVERGIKRGALRDSAASRLPLPAVWQMTFQPYHPIALNQFLEAHIPYRCRHERHQPRTKAACYFALPGLDVACRAAEPHLKTLADHKISPCAGCSHGMRTTRRAAAVIFVIADGIRAHQ